LQKPKDHASRANQICCLEEKYGSGDVGEDIEGLKLFRKRMKGSGKGIRGQVATFNNKSHRLTRAMDCLSNSTRYSGVMGSDLDRGHQKKLWKRMEYLGVCLHESNSNGLNIEIIPKLHTPGR
jgi:hypothetical protein